MDYFAHSRNKVSVQENPLTLPLEEILADYETDEDGNNFEEPNEPVPSPENPLNCPALPKLSGYFLENDKVEYKGKEK